MFTPQRPLRLRWILVLAGATIAKLTTAAQKPTFVVGVCGHQGSYDKFWPAVVAAADMSRRSSSPVLDIPNATSFDVEFVFGDTEYNQDLASALAIEWMIQGISGRVVTAVIGCMSSSISDTVARVGSIFSIPQISWFSGSLRFTEAHETYTYFSRTIAPMAGVQEHVVWMLAYFSWAQATMFYLYDPYLARYEADVFNEARTLAASKNITIVGVALSTLAYREEVEDWSLWEQSIITGKAYTNVIYLIMCAINGFKAMDIAHAQGLSQHQWIYGHIDNLDILSMPTGVLDAYHGMLGTITLQDSNTLQSSALQDFWSEYITLDAVASYMAPEFRWQMGNETWPETVLSKYHAYLFDAVSALFHGLSHLVSAGYEESQIAGSLLLAEILGTSFEGASGLVTFSSTGDREGMRGDIFNLQSGVLVHVGQVTPENVSFTDSQLVVFANGSLTPPSGLPPSCLEGYYYDGAQCIGCPPGEQAAIVGSGERSGIGRCTPCPTGFVSEGSSQCHPCSPGFTSNSESTECEPCPIGTHAELGGRNCTACPPGSFAGTNGSASCEQCPIGKFSWTSGAAACEQCGSGRASVDLFTTMTRFDANGVTQFQYVVGSNTEAHCGCDAGSREDSFGECVVCTTGMVCPGLGVVLVAPGYYSKGLPDLSIYKCWGDTSRCVGGVPGATCAPGRRSLACSECDEGKMPGSSGECRDCNGADKAPMYLVVLALLIILILLYIITTSKHGKAQSLSMVLCAVAAGQLVTAIQQVVVVGSLALQWKEPLKSLIDATSLFAFDIEVLRLSCFGSMAPLESYILKLVLLLAGVLILCVIHVIFVSVFHHFKFRKHRWSLVASIAAMLLVFYISVAGMTLQPFQCKVHPNNQWTVWQYQSVICWEAGDHFVMLALGFVGILLGPVGFLAAVLTAVWQFPIRMQMADAKFVSAFAFLFFRFQPGKQWYLGLHLAKGLLIASCLVVPDILLETVLLQAILLVGFGAGLVIKPWRVEVANHLDAFLNACLLMLVVFASFFIEDSDKDLGILSWMSFTLLCAGLVMILLAITYGLWRKYFRRVQPFAFFLCHHKAASGAYARLLKMHLCELQRLRGDVFIDSDNLFNLDHLFDFVRSDTRTLVVIATTHIFTRPWCVGEMTTARLKEVFTIVLATPTCKLPDQEVVAELEEHGFPNIEVLIEAGIDLPMIQETLLWVPTLPAIEVPKVINRAVMQSVVERLTRSQAESHKIKGTMSLKLKIDVVDTSAILETKHCFLVHDPDNMEACAACHVLQKMLMPLMGAETDLIPDIVDNAEDLPAKADRYAALLVLCTNGAFTNPQCLRMIVVMQRGAYMPIPVLAESSFRFPPQDALTWLHTLSLTGFDDDLRLEAAAGLGMLFKEIAASFEPQHASNSVLEVHAKQLEQRIQRHRRSFGKAPGASPEMFSERDSARGFCSSQGSGRRALAATASPQGSQKLMGHASTKASKEERLTRIDSVPNQDADDSAHDVEDWGDHMWIPLDV